MSSAKYDNYSNLEMLNHQKMQWTFMSTLYLKHRQKANISENIFINLGKKGQELQTIIHLKM